MAVPHRARVGLRWFNVKRLGEPMADKMSDLQTWILRWQREAALAAADRTIAAATGRKVGA